VDDLLFFDRLDAVLREPDPYRAFMDLATLYRAASAEQQELIRKGWRCGGARWGAPSRLLQQLRESERRVDLLRFARKWRLPDAARLLLPQAEPGAPEARLRALLVHQAIDGGEVDYRDNLMGIVLLYHAAVRLALDPDRLFEETAGISAPSMAALLRSFPRRASEDRSLAAFGYAERPTPDGILFEPARREGRS